MVPKHLVFQQVRESQKKVVRLIIRGLQNRNQKMLSKCWSRTRESFGGGKELKRGNTKATAHSLKLNHTKCRAAKRNIDKQRQRERERAHTHSPQTNFFSFLNFSTATSQATKNLPFHFASEIKHWGSAQKKKKEGLVFFVSVWCCSLSHQLSYFIANPGVLFKQMKCE